MKSIYAAFVFFSALLILAGCNNATYKKTPGGMPYQLFESKDTVKIKVGDIMKVGFTQKVNDSVFFTNVGTVPFYIPVSSNTNPYDLSELWTKIKQGDSLVTTQMMDTFIKRNPQGIDPQFKNGDRILTYVKILKVFKKREDATADEEKEKQLLKEKEAAGLANYLKEKNIKAQKTPSGAYVETISPGVGNVIDSGKYVTVNYTGTSFSGVRFDSNTDTSFHHVAPMSFTVSAVPPQMIQGFDEAVRLMKKGEKAKVYIPSTLAYGANPQSPKIKPYENLIFDLEIVDIADKAPAPPAAPKSPAEKK